MKKMSAKKMQERLERRKKMKKERLILTLSAIPPFVFTIVTIILYACKLTYSWLMAVTASAWLLLGGLFIYANAKKWGYANLGNSKGDEKNSVFTIYNIVLIFALAALFIFLFIRQIT